MKKKLFIATPAYDGKVNVSYVMSLLNTTEMLRANGIEYMLHIPTSSSLLVAERNRILELFWMSDATHALLIDSDLGWPAEAVIAMLNEDKEIVAGVYPARPKPNGVKGFMFRPILNPDGSLVTKKHLIKAEGVPAGFMLISKDAIKKMRDKFPELYYAPKDSRNDSESTYCLFNTEIIDGEFWGEDYVFCHRALIADVEVWIDPLITFDHGGTIGALHSILTDDPAKAGVNHEAV